MLVLSRTRDSGIHIGSDITVKVLSMNRSTVKLGIEAPQSVRVWRDELAAMCDDQSPADAEPTAAVGMKIVLVIEDDPGHAKLIRKALCRSQGTMVTVAETGAKALDALGVLATSPEDLVQPDLVQPDLVQPDLVQPDLILLDLGLPDGSGLDVLRTIRSVPELRTAPVVVLSCSDDEALMQQCLEAGANAFVAKSGNYDDFHALVRRIGQFWAGDCLVRKHKLSSGHGDPLASPSAGASAFVADANEAHQELVGIQGKKILLVDDDRGHVTLITRALRRANIGCAIDVVGNGVEAIDYLFGTGECAERQPNAMPDMILLDLNMPEMNGRQVLQVLRKARRKEGMKLPPVVVLTSSDEETDINDSYNLGAQSFIRKPAHHGNFMEAVQRTTTYWLGLNESPSRESSVARRKAVPR